MGNPAKGAFGKVLAAVGAIVLAILAIEFTFRARPPARPTRASVATAPTQPSAATVPSTTVNPELKATSPRPLSPRAPSSVTLAMIGPMGADPFTALRESLRKQNTQLSVDTVALGQWKLPRYDTAWITAAQLAELVPLQRQEIKRFIETGGTLFVETSAAPAQQGTIERQFASLFTKPELTFSDAIPGDRRIRVGELSDRPAVLLNTHGPQAEHLLEALLAQRAKEDPSPPPPSRPQAFAPRSIPAFDPALLRASDVDRIPTAPKSDELHHAITSARTYLMAHLNKTGNWERVPRPNPFNAANPDDLDAQQYGALTAFATWALLQSGEPADNLAAPIAFLDQLKTASTQVVAVRASTNAFLARHPIDAGRTELLRADGARLLQGVATKGTAAGFYTVDLTPDKAVAAQFYNYNDSALAVAALADLAGRDLEIPTLYWRLVRISWLSTAVKPGQPGGVGGWSDNPVANNVPTLVSTALGAQTLLACREMLAYGRGAECKPIPADPPLDAALQFLAAAIATDPTLRPPLTSQGFHTLLALRRAAILAGGEKYFGPTDWFAHGAAALLKSRGTDGGFPTPPGVFADDSPVLRTSLALLFLSHSRGQPWLTKLRYTDPKSDSDARFLDATNVTRWLGVQLDKELRCQVVDLDAWDDFTESPVAYIEGHRPLDLTEAQKGKLKAYIDRGGTLLVNADCDDPAFARSVRLLGETLYPALAWKPLGPAHPLFNPRDLPPMKPGPLTGIEGLGDGKRERIILIARGDPSRYWHLRHFSEVRLDWYNFMRAVYLYTAK